jgi:hypothetical protein
VQNRHGVWYVGSTQSRTVCSKTEPFARKELPNHLTVCLLQKINCAYQKFGCQVSGTRQSVEEHNNSSNGLASHLNGAVQRIEALTDLTNALHNRVQQLDQELKTKQAKDPSNWFHPVSFF